MSLLTKEIKIRHWTEITNNKVNLHWLSERVYILHPKYKYLMISNVYVAADGTLTIENSLNIQIRILSLNCSNKI